MLLATAVVAVSIVLYMSNRTISSSQTAAVAFSGPGPLDYAAAHQELLNEIDRNRYSSIDTPEWAEHQLSELRSDWLQIEKNGARNFIHISSSKTQFNVNVWVFKRRLGHQTVYRENLLRNEVIPEFAEWWDDWLAENQSEAKNGG